MKRSPLKVALVAVAALAAPGTSSIVVLAGERAAPAPAFEAAPAPREATLANGARLLVLPQGGSPVVLIAAAVAAGSWDEPPGRAGLSHYLEHLLFDGFDDLDERGVTVAFERIGGYVNAFTREQTTVFFALAPRERGAEASRLLAGMLARSTIAPAAFEKERGVILAELARDAAQPDFAFDTALVAALWGGAAPGIPVGGVPAQVEATTREEVIAYWRARYTGRGMTLIVAGDGGTDALATLADPFAALQASKPAAPRVDPLAWPGWGRAAIVPVESGRPERIELVIAVPDELASRGTEVEVLARWLDGAGGPLDALRAREGVRRASVSRLPRTPRDLLAVSLEAAPGTDARAWLADLLGAIDGAAAGPAPHEVRAIERTWAAERALARQRLHHMTILAGEALATARGSLLEAIDAGAVDAERVGEAARLLLGGDGVRARARAALATSAAGAEAGARLPRPASAGAARSAAKSAGAGDGAFVAGPLGARVTTLANGLVLGVLEEPGAPVFGIHVLVADRALRETATAAGLADLAHRTLAHGGSAVSPGEALRARLEQLGVDFKAADDPRMPFDDRDDLPEWSYLRLEGPAPALEPALALLAEVIAAPAIDESAYAKAAAELETARKGWAASRASSRAALRRLLGDRHPLASAVPGEPGDAVPNLADVRTLVTSGWLAPSRLIVTVASPRSAQDVRALVAPLLGHGKASPPVREAWPGAREGGAKPQVANAGTKGGGMSGAMPDAMPGPMKGGMPGAMPGGAGPRVSLTWASVVDVPEPRRVALRLAIEALTDRMVATIREREGLAYRVGAGVRAIPGGSWLLSAEVSTAPENRERVQSLMAGILADLAATPLSALELARLAGRQERGEMLGTLTAIARATRLGRAIYGGESAIERVPPIGTGGLPTPEEVREAAAEYVGGERLVVVEIP